MDADQTLKILKMVQEGFLTAEQGQRLIQELIDGSASGAGAGTSPPRPTPTPPPTPETPDLFRMVEDAGKTFTQGFEKLFGFASQTVKDGLGMGPQNVVLKVLDVEGVVERYQVTVPYKIFTALRPLLVQKPPMVVHPIQNIDYTALFESLDSGQTGRIFEYIDHARGDRLEVWVQ